MKLINDAKVIQGIKEQNDEVLQYIYKKYFRSVRRVVLDNHGDMVDARDIFQEAIVVIYRKIHADEYNGETGGIKTYLISVARFLWLKELRNRRESKVVHDEYGYLECNPNITDHEYERGRRYALYQKHFMQLGEECQKLLGLLFENKNYKEIADSMNYASDKFVKKKKYRCKEQLIRAIKNDPEFDDYDE